LSPRFLPFHRAAIDVITPGDPRRVRGARHQVREGQPSEGAQPGAEGGRIERRDRDGEVSATSSPTHRRRFDGGDRPKRHLTGRPGRGLPASLHPLSFDQGLGGTYAPPP